jgi:hypothetical protein
VSALPRPTIPARLLWGLLAVGVLLRLALAAKTDGVAYDLQSLEIVGNKLASGQFLHAYAPFRWPYPPGWFPVVWATHEVSSATGLAFTRLIRVPPALCDAGIAWLVAGALAYAGRSMREQLAGAALVMLGPSFWIISGVHGQIDAATVLPALAATLIWITRGEGEQRRAALLAGVLLGIAVSIKTTPAFLLLVLLPSVRSRDELLRLVVPTLAIPVVLLAPFLLADHITWDALKANHGVPGFGGLSSLLQPDITNSYLKLGSAPVVPRHIIVQLTDHQNLIVGIAVVAAAALAHWRRLSVLDRACAIWLAVYVANPNWAYQYLIWGLPFFLAAGRLRAVALLQLVLLLPALQLYFHGRWVEHGLYHAYLPLVTIAWVGIGLALLALLLRATPAATRSPTTSPATG